MNRAERAQNTTDALIAAALEVLGREGLKGTTTRAIAERAGVNEVTLFRKFGSKDGLVREAVSEVVTTFTQESVVHTGDLEADLIRLITDYKTMLGRYGPVARALLTEVPFDDRVAPSLEPLRAVLRAVAGLLSRYQDEGALEREAPETQIPALLGPIAMPIVTGGLGLLPSDEPAPQFDPATHVRRFLRGRAAG
ncbi:TetR/AcrR family transcriptional regulator [Tessaracoccus sp. HDW20]|uniref:TetR/AcrR family transcriptional regulator n=1 Tax=Tessaracoccus coleopterorum TaxID=2714950 RepID=UPI0018D2B5DB|nr:TetR/AcrR family transcriptional regulator [Tessaracoccus coleopterorum]NHB85300.1 TetR/AcrR family transcriptional regulator [Tessaracoccus coleopterorum]